MNMESVAKAVSCLPELVPFKDKKGLWIFGESESKRRVIMIEKTNGSYGFTLQSYGVRYKHGNRETDFITYVNAVEKDGAAYYSGLREGDVILSINGQNMARVEHKSLVSFIRKCPTHLKMVVVSDERARKVELHMRYVHLQKKLHDKMKELEQLNWKEKEILGSPLGVPCLSAPTSSCCFCPPKTKPSVILDEKEKAKTISTTTAVAATADKSTDKETFYYDCYRKSQSHRELHHRKDSKAGCMSGSGTTTTNNNNSNTNNNNNTISSSGGNIVKLTNPGSESCNNNSTTSTASCSSTTTTTASQNTKAQQKSSACDPQSKPKSWDSLMTTNSTSTFGGYGYGYSPIQHSTQLCNHHPHHHHHHFNYNYSKNATRQSRQSDQGGGGTYFEHRQCPIFRHAPFQIVTTGATIRPGSSSASGKPIGTSKTLPSTRRDIPDCLFKNFENLKIAKMEKTLSDSSLNSEHHKDFPKTMRLLNRSSENVRYSDEDEYDQCKSTEVPVGHDIFV